MGERKVLNKYFPPDFDPTKIRRVRRGRDFQYKVRLMAPFHMRCTTCGHFIYKGTKFLAVKEDAPGEKYLGIQIFRFYIKCPRCSSEITFKTDPENTDYVCEQGAKRNLTEYRKMEHLTTMKQEIEEEKKEEDAMELLEQRTRDSKREMEILDALEDVQDMNARNAQVDVNDLVRKMEAQRRRQAEEKARKEKEEEERLISEVMYKGQKIRRVKDTPDQVVNGKSLWKRKKPSQQQQQQQQASSSSSSSSADGAGCAQKKTLGIVGDADSSSDSDNDSASDSGLQTLKKPKMGARKGGPANDKFGSRKSIGSLGGLGSLKGLVKPKTTTVAPKVPEGSTASKPTRDEKAAPSAGLVGYDDDSSSSSSDDE